MKQLFYVLLILCTAVGFTVLSAQDIRWGTLRELSTPETIAIQGNQLYVMDNSEIFVYSLRGPRLLRQLGGVGRGRGKLPGLREGANVIHLANNYLLAEGRRKMIFFSKTGGVIDEKPKSDHCTQFTPLGNHWVAKKYLHDVKTNTQYMRVAIFNPGLEEVRELHREKWFQQYTDKGFRIQLFSDYLNFEVYGGKVFIEKSPLGFVIDVYDEKGDFLYRIKKDIPAPRVTPGDKKQAMATLRRDRKAELMIHKMGSWEKVLKVMDVTFPKYKPVIRNFEIDDDKIYVRTFREKDNRDETIIMDLKGNILKTVYLPVFHRPGVEGKMYDARYNIVSKDVWYGLKQNNNHWELHKTEIK